MKVAIVGAGISGLSLAYFLQKKGIQVRVFERDDRFDSERQGFSLTMQGSTYKIFEEYGILDEILKLGCRTTKQVFYNSNGQILYENCNNDQDRFNYPLPRQEIRRIFYNGLEQGTVIFGHKVDDLTTLNADYIVVCCGINNKFIKVELNDLGLYNVYGLAKTTDKFKKSEIQVLDGHHRFFSKPFNSEMHMWELTWPSFKEVYEKYEAGIDIRKESLLACQKVVEKWSDSLLWISDFMKSCRVEDIIVHPLYDIDPETINFVNNNIIYIGDAVHAMSPYIGKGANEALKDSYELAKVLVSQDKPNLQKFYDEMVKRSRKSVIRSRENTKFYHSPDATNVEKLWQFKGWTKQIVDIRNLSNIDINKRIGIRARVHKITIKKNFAFLILRYQTTSIQVICSKKNLGEDRFHQLTGVTHESVVDCEGILRASPVKIESTTYHDFELELLSFDIISHAVPLPFQIEDANDFGESFRSNVGTHTRLESRWVDLRTPVNNAIFKIQSDVTQYFREYLLGNDFMEIHSPKIIGVASEGGAQVFELKYFDKPAYLAQSPQLYKQMAINSDFDRVFEIGPVFRAEQSLTIRHMCEFIGLDIEMAINQGRGYVQVQEVLWSTLIYIFDMLKSRSSKSVNLVREKIDSVNPVYPREPLIIKFKDCVQLLRNDGKVQDDFEDLSSENEKRLGEIVKAKYNSDLFIIDQYPTKVRPFYTMRSEDDPNYTNSYDVIFRCTEISSGSQREHRYNVLLERIKELGISHESLKYYLESFSHGSRPHGGAGLGLERIVSLYLDLGNVKMASLCPRDPKRLFP